MQRSRRLLGALTLGVLGLLAACGADEAADADRTPGTEDDETPLPNPTTRDQVPDSGYVGPDDPVKPSDPPIGTPGTFDDGEFDVETVIDTTKERRRISPFIYGVNSFNVSRLPADVLASVSFVRRGGDRGNTYNWETNLSTNSIEQQPQSNDLHLVEHLSPGDQAKPGAFDLDMIARTRAAGVGAMVPFVLHDYVAKVPAGDLDWQNWSVGGGERDGFFARAFPVKPTALSTSPNPNDDAVYSDEHFAFLKAKVGDDLYLPGQRQVLVGIDNEPDIYAYNFPYLQAGSGFAIRAPDTNNVVGNLVDGIEFTNEKFLPFAKRVKELEPTARIVGPTHYHYDGYTNWEDTMPGYGNDNWFMDTFLDLVKAESDRVGKRLLDIWDFHWYPQGYVDGEMVEWVNPNEPAGAANAARRAARVDAIVQSPRSYWDHDYDEGSWVSGHTNGPTYIIERIQKHLAEHYPGTPAGISEYFPGGCGHIASGLGVADSLGIFMRMGVGLAAMWQHCYGQDSIEQLRYAFGAFKLLRNADGNRLRFDDTVVPVTHPDAEKAATSVYAGSDDKPRMTVLVVNKRGAARRIALRAFHSAELKSVDVYRIDAANPSPVLAQQDRLAKLNAWIYEAPPFSASMLVFKTAP